MPEIIKERYALLGKPISGGMAEIYKATDLKQEGNIVAVKLFNVDKTGEIDDILKESFRRETLALRELKHDNIVELYDSGIDENTGRHFLVMPWLGQDLEKWLENNEFLGWDDFYEQIGRPILQGLAFAHERLYIHRDLKPRNILITDTGYPKITDFGISKIKSYLEPSVTLADFGSKPYTPREFDDGSYSYTRDVYSFAVVAIRCLTKVKLKTYEDVYLTFNDDVFDAPDDILRVIEQCLAKPEDRQRTAGLLLDELDQIQIKRSANWIAKRDCYLRLNPKILQSLKQSFGFYSDKEAIDFVLEDLNAISGIKFGKNKEGEIDKRNFDIFGESLTAHVSIDNRDQDHFFVFSISHHSSVQLENLREFSWIPDRNLTFQYFPVQNNQKARETLESIQLEVDKKTQEIILSQKRKEEEKHFWIWDRMLRLKSEVEKKRNLSLSYSGFSLEDYRVVFNLKTVPPEDALDQERQVKLGDGSLIKGVVSDIRENKLFFSVTDGNPNMLPNSGLIEFDTKAAEIAINRQKEALDAVRFERSLNPILQKRLAKPSKTKIPEEIDLIDFFTKDLDSAKKDGIKKALGAEELLVVEGPPGTGKTTYIAELILQTLKKNPDARILLTSQTHVALDNALERLTKVDKKLKIVRIASVNTTKSVADSTVEYLLANQMNDWKKDVLEKGKSFLKDWADKHNVSKGTLEVGTMIREFLILKKRMNVDSEALIFLEKELLNIDANDVQTTREIIEEQIAESKTEIQNIKKKLQNTEKLLKDLQEQLMKLDEDATEFLTWSLKEIEDWATANYFPNTAEDKKLLKLIEIHTEWEQQFGSREEFKVALLSTAQVIAGTCLGIASIKGYQDLNFDLCIVDEASKATPTETLIPMVRARKWILVGDERQLSPFQATELQKDENLERYELRKSDLRQSLFSYLSQNLPKECVSSLTAQHRMVEPIGRLISECFYEGRLEHFGPAVDPTLSDIFHKPVTWFSTLKLTDRFEKRIHHSQSYANFAEANVIYNLLHQINQKATLAGKNYKVALVAGYSAQRSEIDRRISKNLSNWESLELQLNTVDAFQGREADIVIYSVTRANSEGNIGFLRDFERINVALSRGRLYLAIVGDHYFCQFQSGDNPLKKVVDYIAQNINDCKLSIQH